MIITKNLYRFYFIYPHMNMTFHHYSYYYYHRECNLYCIDIYECLSGYMRAHIRTSSLTYSMIYYIHV